MDNFKIIYKILLTLEKSMDFDSVDMDRLSPEYFKVSQERWNKYMEMLVDAGYVKGVLVKKRYSDGDLSINISDIRITLKGLEYLSKNSIMRRTYKTTKGISDLVP